MYGKVAATLAMVACYGLAGAQQGVTSDEILIGSIQDLSGPLASVSKQARAGMLLRVDEINEQGGINGRKLRLLVEDAGYDPKRASLAAQKLVNRDNIFAMVGHIGTAQNVAAMSILAEKNVVNFFPLSGAKEMYEAPNKLKFAFMPGYLEQMQDATTKLVREKGFKRVCTMYQDDEAGQEIFRGAETGLKSLGMDFVEKTSFKRGSTDFFHANA
jgi:branched-chain amino acid transport system substrate-binding protein